MTSLVATPETLRSETRPQCNDRSASPVPEGLPPGAWLGPLLLVSLLFWLGVGTAVIVWVL